VWKAPGEMELRFLPHALPSCNKKIGQDFLPRLKKSQENISCPQVA
jgi:hypothetical protein